MSNQPDLVHQSDRESLSVRERIDLMRAELLQPPFTNLPTRHVTPANHDLLSFVGRMRNTVSLYDLRKRHGGTDEEIQERVGYWQLSETECLALAWTRGGHDVGATHRAMASS